MTPFLFKAAILVAFSGLYVFTLLVGIHMLHIAPLFIYLAPNLSLIAFSLFWFNRYGIHYRLQKGRGRATTGLMTTTAVLLLIIAMGAYWPDRRQTILSSDIFLLIVLVPISEELFFRGILLDFCEQRMRPIAAIFIVSVLFSIAHLPQGLPTVLVTFVLANILGNVTRVTGSLSWPIAIHIGWNALTVIRHLPPGTSRWIIVACSGVTMGFFIGLGLLSIPTRDKQISNR